jgi:hypothetical protein
MNYSKGTSFLFLFLLLSANIMHSQVVPQDRLVSWEYAGLRDTTTTGYIWINVVNEEFDSSGSSSNDDIMDSLISVFGTDGVIFYFPEGEYLFNHTIHLSSNQVLKGEGMDKTQLNFDLGGAGDAIRIDGSIDNSMEYLLFNDANKEQEFVVSNQTNQLNSGDWIKIYQQDDDLVVSSWALNTVGQICRIEEIEGDTVYLQSSLRMDFELQREPKFKKINMISNVGIECLKIHRLDDAAPEQASNVAYHYCSNSWVKNVESENCTFAHIMAENSSNLAICRSYFHHGFEYGGGGRAYGVALQFTTNECLIEDNIFEHLRHSMLLQAGPNGNVFAYNFSTDPYWVSTSPFIPNDAAGDMVLHGNYPYANLFEQNSGQNIIIDNSHGANGPFNTFFRNRGALFGIFFSDDTSPFQNLVGNEIPNTTSPYSLVNYTIQGLDQFEYGNNNKGVITPAGTETLEDVSYYYQQQPSFLNSSQWSGLGTPNNMGSNSIPAQLRFEQNTIYDYPCEEESPQVNTSGLIPNKEVVLYPNPSSEFIYLECEINGNVAVIDLLGKTRKVCQIVKGMNQISLQNLNAGSYLILMYNSNQELIGEYSVILTP